MIKLAEKLLHLHNPLLLLTMHKASLALYWLPVSLACVCIPRISLENGVMSYCGEGNSQLDNPRKAGRAGAGLLSSKRQSETAKDAGISDNRTAAGSGE